MALQYLTAFAIAIKVNEGIKTSSFCLTPDKIHDICKADVPEFVVITYFAPVNFEIFLSNFYMEQLKILLQPIFY